MTKALDIHNVRDSAKAPQNLDDFRFSPGTYTNTTLISEIYKII